MSQTIVYDRIEYAGGWWNLVLNEDGSLSLAYYCRGGEATGEHSTPIQGGEFPPEYAAADLQAPRVQINRLANAIARHHLAATAVYREGTQYIEGVAPP